MQQHEMAMKDQEEVTEYLNNLAAKSANTSMEAMGFGKNFYSVNDQIIKNLLILHGAMEKAFQLEYGIILTSLQIT